MPVRNTHEMGELFNHLQQRVNRIADQLESGVPVNLAASELAMQARHAGVLPSVADEYSSSIEHLLSQVRENLLSISKNLGASSHCVAALEHKANPSGRKIPCGGSAG